MQLLCRKELGDVMDCRLNTRQEPCTVTKKKIKRLKKEYCWEIQKEHLASSTLPSPARVTPVNMSYFGCHPVMEWEGNSETWPRSVRSARSLQSLGLVAWLGSAIPLQWRWDVPQVEGFCREEEAHLWPVRNKGLKLQGGQAPFGCNTHQE